MEWDEILHTIARPNAEWTYYETPSTGQKHPVNEFLNLVAKVWS